MASGNVGNDNFPEIGPRMKAFEMALVKAFIGLIGVLGGLGIVRAITNLFLNPEAFFVSSFLLLLSIGLYAEKICLENATLIRGSGSLKTKLIEDAAKVEILDIFVQSQEKELEESESECEIGTGNTESNDFNEMVKMKDQDDAGEPKISATTNSTIADPQSKSKIMTTIAEEEKLVESGDGSVEIII